MLQSTLWWAELIRATDSTLDQSLVLTTFFSEYPTVLVLMTVNDQLMMSVCRWSRMLI